MSLLTVHAANGRIEGWVPPQDGGLDTSFVELPFAPTAKHPGSSSLFAPLPWSSPSLMYPSPSPSPGYTSSSSRRSSSSSSHRSSPPLSRTATPNSGYSSRGSVPRNSTERRFKKQRSQNPDYAPRPENSFILFRNRFVEENRGKGSSLLEGDHYKSLSKLAAEAWASLPATEKDEWNKLAEKAREEHAKKYPNYRYRPKRRTQRTKIQNASPTTNSLPSLEGQAVPVPVPVMLQSVNTSAIDSSTLQHEVSPTSATSVPATPENEYGTTFPEVSACIPDTNPFTLRESQTPQGGALPAMYRITNPGYITKPTNAMVPLFNYSVSAIHNLVPKCNSEGMKPIRPSTTILTIQILFHSHLHVNHLLTYPARKLDPPHHNQ